jgi:starch-binding outer membrane protein, SusD/RagB family
MKKLLLIFVFFGVVQFSCTELETDLYDILDPSVFAPDVSQELAVIYAPMREFLDGGGWWFAQELTGDGVAAPTRAGDWDDGGKWVALHRHTWDNNTEAINSMWSRFYTGVLEANKFLDKYEPLAGNPAFDDAIAKAKILRSYYYYLLIDNYGNVPYLTSFIDAPAQPGPTPRADIFNAIVEDIEESIPFLLPSQSTTGMTKEIAFSILAKLYLNHAVYTGTTDPTLWQKAVNVTDSIIQSGRFSLESNPLAPFVTNNENSSENIWVIPFHETTYTGFNLHMRTLHYNSNLTFDMQAGPWNGFAAVYDHFMTYSLEDLRREGFLVGPQFSLTGQPITDAGANNLPLDFNPVIPALVMRDGFTPEQIRMSGARVAKFEIKKGAIDNLTNDFPIFRYGDVLLMKAEGLIRLGQNGDNYVNHIRQRAGLTPWQDVTLTQLLEERGREMFWEGHRRQDLIRFGEFNKAWWEKPASDPNRNTFPIPQWVIDSNPNLAK